MRDFERQPEAAVAIIEACAPVPSVLLIRRAERDRDPWSGHWSLPGGRREACDRGVVETAVRETAEECGIELTPERVEAALAPRVARRSAPPYLLVQPFVFRLDHAVEAVVDSAEAVEARWVQLDELRDPARHQLQRVPRQPRSVLFPAFPLPPVPLWGFTYRLLVEWLELRPSGDAAEEILRSCGLPLAHGWIRTAGGARIAAVRGRIPAEAMLERFGGGWGVIPPVNALEVRPDLVRVVGLEFEESLIVGLLQ